MMANRDILEHLVTGYVFNTCIPIIPVLLSYCVFRVILDKMVNKGSQDQEEKKYNDTIITIEFLL